MNALTSFATSLCKNAVHHLLELSLISIGLHSLGHLPVDLSGITTCFRGNTRG
jgi:hypothetical protein